MKAFISTWGAAIPVLAVLSAVGCAHPVFHSGTGRSYAPLPADCKLRAMGALPGPGYEEIGTITIEGDRSAGTGYYTNPEDFVKAAQAQVCAAGGEVVVTEVSGDGYVARGIVFRQSDKTAVPQAESSAALRADKAAAPSAPPVGKTPAPSVECTPICSPGFGCNSGQCVPLCNPACLAGEQCGRDRLCHKN